MSATVLAPLAKERPLLEVVNRYDPEVPYQQWRPQIIVPEQLPPFAGLPVTIVVVNQKGGAGKTTTALELAAAWAARGYRVRLIDADPQEASLSLWLPPQYPDGIPAQEQYNLTDVYLERCTLDQASWPTRYKGLTIVPSGVELAQVEYDPKIVGAENSLRYGIEDSANAVDINIIDSGPTLGKLSISGLIAARHAIVPAAVGGLDILGIRSLSEAIARVQRRANRDLDVRAAVLTAWEKSTLARDLAARMAEDWPEAIIAPVRVSIRSGESSLAQMAILEYEPKSTTASDYSQLADLVIPRIPQQGAR